MSNKILLVADDYAMFVNILSFECEKRQLPWQVITVSDGEHTIRMLTENKPDALVLDLRMPKVDGFQVLEHMQKNQSHVPVIVVTHYQDSEHREKSMAYGAKQYIVKSEWKISRLVEEIGKHLGVTA